MNFGTVNGKIYKNTPPAVFYSIENLKETIPENGIIILDFWNTGCGICFKKFPLLDSINRNNNIGAKVILVNIPLNGERKEDNFNRLDSFHYGFKQLFAEDHSSIVQKFKIISYPTTFIIKNNKLIFKGDIEDGLKYL